jgi:hypothetical protein
MSWNGFGELDLSKVEKDDGGGGAQRLTTGTYNVKCTSAIVETIGDSENKRVVADFEDADGKGDIRMNFNVHHTSSQAKEIGLRQLKSFLVAAGHKTPDQPGDVASLVKLECKIYVGMGKPWTDKTGNQRQQTEIKSFSPLDEASTKKPSKDLDDEIPF